MSRPLQRIFTCTVEVFDQLAELPEAERSLVELAAAARAKSYAPYSNFQVGAAVQLANSERLSGANQENAAYPMCLCAEQVTLAAASAQYPKVPVTYIAVTVAKKGEVIAIPAAPCGACRQVIAEYQERGGQPIILLLRAETGPIYRLLASDLLPMGFNSEFLV